MDEMKLWLSLVFWDHHVDLHIVMALAEIYAIRYLQMENSTLWRNSSCWPTNESIWNGNPGIICFAAKFGGIVS